MRQTSHLHAAIDRAEKQEQHYEKMTAEMDQEETKLRAMTAKVVAQNQVLERMIAEETRKRRHPEFSQREEVIASSSQSSFYRTPRRTENGGAMGPPLSMTRSVGLSASHRPKANVTRL